jgi:hypothetical protein
MNQSKEKDKCCGFEGKKKSESVFLCSFFTFYSALPPLCLESFSIAMSKKWNCYCSHCSLTHRVAWCYPCPSLPNCDDCAGTKSKDKHIGSICRMAYTAAIKVLMH